MPLEKITQVTGNAVPVLGDDIDTDRIIPARFMKCVTFDSLGEYFFYDIRKNEDGSNKEHPLNEERYQNATIMLSGNNFGCGSSREHAPQALFRAGYKAIIAEGYAEIFFGNSTQLGIPCVSASKADIAKIVAAVEADPTTEISIDLVAKTVRFAGQEIAITMREGNREGLIQGRWDPIADLQSNNENIEKVAEKSTLRSRLLNIITPLSSKYDISGVNPRLPPLTRFFKTNLTAQIIINTLRIYDYFHQK